MRIFNHSLWPVNAVSSYRSNMPISSLKQYADDLKLPFHLTVDEFHPSTKPTTRLYNFHQADLVQCVATIAVQLYQNLDVLESAIPFFDPESGRVKTTPAFVIDFDDLYHDIGFTNPAFGRWGVHRPDGTLMEPGDRIEIETDDGPVVVWEDGKLMSAKDNTGGEDEYFDVESNHGRLATLQRIMNQADLLTFSTARLRDIYVNDFGVKARATYVYPNSISTKEWDEASINVVQDPSQVRILWQGGWSHADDLFEIREAVGRISARFPQVKWVIFGHKFKWFNGLIPDNQLEYHPWVPYEQYKMKLNALNADINLAPLRNTRFNCGKSAIKFYEAAMCTKRIPTIASNVGPYADDMKHEETGLLFGTPEQFEAQVADLIANPEKRRRLGEAAREWVVENRGVKVTTPGLYEAYKETSERAAARRRYFIQRKSENNFAILADNHTHVGPSKGSCCPGCRVPV